MTDTTEHLDLHLPLNRRSFLRGALATGAGAALAGPFGALAARSAGADPGSGQGQPTGLGYGPLRPVRDATTGLELLLLPRGFEYMSFGWRNDPMSDGIATPSSHDGMAAFRRGDLVHLVRNHERDGGVPFAGPDRVYDGAAAGGTTNLVFDPDRAVVVESYASLSGTIRNCAGGPTPRGTWLTCEETTTIIAGTRHGYIFEVPSDGASNAVPLTAMGRFSHEATATDPATGFVYETEDAGSSALYRFRPADPSNLAAGGVLEAMRLAGTADTREWTTGTSAAIEAWVTVDSPDWAPPTPSPWNQVRVKGAARISRGEGAWYGNGLVYIVSTDGAPTRQGQVFALDPVAGTFTCVFASPSSGVLNAPDNICVSPRGGLVLCEDGSGLEFLHGLSPAGEIFPFAQNNLVLPASFEATKGYSGDFSGSEWAGATFEPTNGQWLFANLQSPGITFAITGPWRQGAL
ncbi:MAG TPA: alkaline phosphatase PhoX [Acidimicrobiales bacterium]